MYSAAPHPLASTLACQACACIVRATPTRSDLWWNLGDAVIRRRFVLACR